MSEAILNELSTFQSYKYEPMTNRIVNLRGVTNADMDEFLAIAHILDSNFIKYKFSTNIDIRIIGKK